MSRVNPVKNLIFVTGNALSEYRTIAENLSKRMCCNVLVDDNSLGPHVYDTFKDVGAKKSLFFSQVLFYGSLPSRRIIIVSTPNMSVKTLLQFIKLFKKENKNVFIVVNDR